MGGPTFLHLPGLHGDWTLLGPLRQELAGRARLIEVTYPRRLDWSLADYARAVALAVSAHRIDRCWLLGESFSSQVAWQLLDLRRNSPGACPLEFEGLILVGGFVRHPWPWGVLLARCASALVPIWLLRLACACYGQLARRRCPSPQGLAELREFVARRSTSGDRAAITARYRLIHANDPRPTASTATLPVFQLSGAWDPIVPWWQVRPWLRRHCPGYVSSRILWTAGHNVLLSAPQVCARQLLAWAGAHAPKNDSERLSTHAIR